MWYWPLNLAWYSFIYYTWWMLKGIETSPAARNPLISNWREPDTYSFMYIHKYSIPKAPSWSCVASQHGQAPNTHRRFQVTTSLRIGRRIAECYYGCSSSEAQPRQAPQSTRTSYTYWRLLWHWDSVSQASIPSSAHWRRWRGLRISAHCIALLSGRKWVHVCGRARILWKILTESGID
jgi:hypothetical protein